jgi:SAM-dependent methyltransferase
MNDYKVQFYPETSFGGFTDVDGSVAFYTRVNALLRPAFSVVDFGCGRGVRSEDSVPLRRNLCILKGKVSQVIGVDVDEAGQANPCIDEFRFLDPGRPWPLDDNSVDMIVCDSVMEHLPDPRAFFQEAKRTLVRGGYLSIRTPNVLSYLGIASKLVPNRRHAAVLSKVQTARKDEDVFPTLYRCNTISALRREFEIAQFRAVVYGYNPEPSYLNFSKLAYAVGVLYQKIVPDSFGPSIFAFGQSPNT